MRAVGPMCSLFTAIQEILSNVHGMYEDVANGKRFCEAKKKSKLYACFTLLEA